jgi:hypothetical protein
MSDPWAYGYDVPDAPDAPADGSVPESPGVQLDPRQMEMAPDRMLMTYAPVIAAIQSIGSGTFVDTRSPADVARGSTDSVWKDSTLGKFATWMGFSNQNDFAKALLPAATMVGGGIISGLGAGYAASQKRKLEKQALDSQMQLNAAHTAKLQAQAANQAGIAGMKVNQSGLIGAPWKAAPIVPVSQRTA